MLAPPSYSGMAQDTVAVLRVTDVTAGDVGQLGRDAAVAAVVHSLQ